MAQRSTFGEYMASTNAGRPRADVSSPAQPVDPRLHDSAKDILSAAVGMNDDQRATAWEHFHSVRDSKDLAQRLHTVDAPNDVKSALFTAKQISDPVPTHAEKIVDAINRMVAMDPRELEISESHPNILRAFLSAKGDE